MAAYSHILNFTCITCGRTYPLAPPRLVCSECGSLAGTLDVDYDLTALAASFTPHTLAQRADTTIWRYHELLPIEDPTACVPIPVGQTPLYGLPANPAFRIGGVRRLLVKDETRNPTASAKDRATAIAVARARMRKLETIAAASTGNAASSLAAFAARAA